MSSPSGVGFSTFGLPEYHSPFTAALNYLFTRSHALYGACTRTLRHGYGQALGLPEVKNMLVS
ncbi:hypothetical protein I7I50_02640 [Histoplasma capsulatum G186AR]|uniref:Uncharacterized protein n=1 Tax=Ajellomyces capsulatus TaxID=5037 RepID=A0A8H7Z513_AJECA|nr:hypothetical protein I7I52_00694 [Histoplasma capsulatum]QSS71699.1 hypothetical protein I7I50_02640 [Histoplasma capsulatum G186AR]